MLNGGKWCWGVCCLYSSPGFTPCRVPVSSLGWAQGGSFSQELWGEPSPGKCSQMNGSFFVQGNARFPCQGIFCFSKRGVKGRGEQCRVYFKVHLDFISSKSCELPEQGEEPLAPWFSFPSSLRPFPVSALEAPEGLGDRGAGAAIPHKASLRGKSCLKEPFACCWSRIEEQNRDARSQNQPH